MFTDYANTAKTTYKVTTTAGSPAYYFSFDAVITELAPENLTVDGKLEVSMTLTVSGAVVISNT